MPGCGKRGKMQDEVYPEPPEGVRVVRRLYGQAKSVWYLSHPRQDNGGEESGITPREVLPIPAARSKWSQEGQRSGGGARRSSPPSQEEEKEEVDCSQGRRSRRGCEMRGEMRGERPQEGEDRASQGSYVNTGGRIAGTLGGRGNGGNDARGRGRCTDPPWRA